MIAADIPITLAVHTLADLQRRVPDHARLRAAYVEADAALAAFASALEDPLADIDPLARRAYLAALVLRATLDAMPDSFAPQKHTADRMLETFEPFMKRRYRSAIGSYVPSEDFDRDARPKGAAPDVGADEAF